MTKYLCPLMLPCGTKMKTGGMIVILWIFVSGTVSSIWSTQINSMFRTRTTKALTNFSQSPELVNSIAFGAKTAINTCKEMFKWDRWNCPESAFSKRFKHPFSKETAYTQAIIAAGVVHSVTKNCSRGEIVGCGCDPERSGPLNVTLAEIQASFKKIENKKGMDWTWGGCSDNTGFAERVAKHILNSLEEGNDAQAYSTLHNNLVGRKIVRDSMTKQCRCHGISGSCTLQTCWMQLAPFPEIARTLKEKYRRAVQIKFENAPDDVTMGNSAKVSVGEIQKTDSNTLVYLEESPDYCKANVMTGWTGTKGRPCSRSISKIDSSEKRSCKNICKTCGHKVRKQKREVSYRCNCVFTYCCEVKCDICTKTMESYYCG